MLAAAYPRFSSDNQREESIDAQMRAIREYADREGHTIVAVYPDEARSATTDNRPEFQKMMADAATGKFECVIVHKLDRFARDRFDSAFYKRQLKKHGVILLSVLERIDGSPESVMLEAVLEGMAEYYSKNLGREVMKGMKENAYQCRHTGGLLPLGYDLTDDKKYVINEYEAEAVRLIFDLYARGTGYNLIIDILHDEGYRTKKGKPFGKNSLNNILSNEKYKGVYVYNRAASKVAGKRNNHKSKNEDEIIRIPGGVPAIVSEEMWDKAAARMDDNRRSQGQYTARTVYMLSGRIICGDCGGAMNGKRARTGRNKVEYCYYECGTRKRTHACGMKPINRDFVEDLVINALFDSVFSPAASREVSRRIHMYVKENRKDIPNYLKAARKELAEVCKQIENIVNAIAKGMFHDTMKEKLDDLESKKAALLIRIDEAERQARISDRTLQEIKEYLRQWSNIKKIPPEEQKAAIEIFVDRVTVYEDDVKVRIRIWTGNPDDGPDGPGGGCHGGSDDSGANKKSPAPVLGGENAAGDGGQFGQGLHRDTVRLVSTIEYRMNIMFVRYFYFRSCTNSCIFVFAML